MIINHPDHPSFKRRGNFFMQYLIHLPKLRRLCDNQLFNSSCLILLFLQILKLKLGDLCDLPVIFSHFLE